MIQLRAVTAVDSTLRARAVFAPVLLALLSLASLASAQDVSSSDAPTATQPAQPSAAQPSTAQPSAAQPSTAQPSTAQPSAAQPSEARASDEHSARSRARVHEGFYLRMTSGPSFISLDGHGPSGSASLTNTGGSGFIAIGGALVPGLVLAGTIQGTAFAAEFDGGPFEHATVSASGKTRSASNRAHGGFGLAGILVDWYPQPRAGWHVGGTTGVGIIDLTNAADDSHMAGANWGGSLFGGYDWSLGRDWSLGLQLVASAATRTKLMDDSGHHDTGYRLTPVSIGVQASLLYF